MPRDDGKFDYHRRQLKEARALIGNRMSWLAGFPVFQPSGPFEWMRLEDFRRGLSAQPISIDRIRGSVQAIKKLEPLGDDIWPQLGRDSQWIHRATAIVQWVSRERLKSPASTDSLLDLHIFPSRFTRTYRQIAAGASELQPLLDAIFFSIASGPQAPNFQDLLWIEENRDRLLAMHRNIPSDSALRWLRAAWCFFELRHPLPKWLSNSLMDLVGKEELWRLDAKEAHGQLLDLQRQIFDAALNPSCHVDLHEPSSESAASQTESFLHHLVTMRDKERTTASSLLEKLIDDGWAARLVAIQRKIDAQLEALVQSLEAWEHYPRGSESDQEHRMLMRDLADFSITPQEVSEANQLTPLLQAIERLSRHPRKAKSWQELLHRIPDEHASMKRWLFLYWEKVLRNQRRYNADDSTFEKWKQQLVWLFTRNPRQNLLIEHWRSQMLLPRSDVEEWVGEMLTEQHSAARIHSAMETLEQLNRIRGSLVPSAWQAMLKVSAAAPSAQKAAEIIDAAANSTRWSGDSFEDDLLTAMQYSETASEVVAILEKMEADGQSCWELTWPAKRIPHPQIRQIARHHLLEGNYNVVKRLIQADTLSKGKSPQWRGPVACATTDWISRFPVELREALEGLAASTPRAAEVAEELLGDSLPSQSRQREEITRLRKILNELSGHGKDTERIARIQQRIENLQTRLAEPVAVSAKRLRHLATKLKRRSEWEWIEAYEAYCQDCFMQHVASRLSPSHFDPQLLHEPYIELLDAILQLTPHFRRLGVQLLIDRHRYPSNPYTDHPANRNFLDKLATAGIVMEPWYQDELVLEGKTAKGMAYRVAFAREVLDYLRMGALFGTCLSPSEGNFYSTISNAVDINKQVLYGKTEDGQVVGRCLFALNQQGRILTYHRYHRDPEDGFDPLVDQFADQLASQMGTRRAGSGKVAKLVSSRWYDDGPIDLPNGIDWDAQEGPLSEILKYSGSDELLGRLAQLAGSVDEVAIHLEQLWSNELLSARPELRLALAQAFFGHAEIEDSLRCRFLVALRSHGSQELYHTFHRRIPLKRLHQLGRRYFCGDCMNFHELGTWQSFGGLLLDHSPSAALRFSRQLADRLVTNPDALGRDEHQAFLEEVRRRLGNR
jgi:hypothetical protein